MKQGSLTERYLKTNVFRQIRNGETEVAKRMEAGPGVGHDYSLLSVPEQSGVITADGFGDSPVMAWYKAMNNFSCSCGECLGARISLLLPKETKASQIDRFMAEFGAVAAAENVAIVGGHSQVSDAVIQPGFLVTLFGTAPENFSFDRKEIKPGYDIVMTGVVGILGTNQLLSQYQEALAGRFSERFVDNAYFAQKEYSVRSVVKCMGENDLVQKSHICYMHDISGGGVYTALWQLGEAIHKGIFIENRLLAIRQETIEICEYLDRNPYFLDGTGSMLIVCEKGRVLTEELKKAGLAVQIVGKVTAEKEKLVYISDKDIRTLSPDGSEE